MLWVLIGDVGFDDIFVYVVVFVVVEMVDELLVEDGCLNFFVGLMDKNFKVLFNFYNVYYNSMYVVGIFGGLMDDMKEVIVFSVIGQLQLLFMVIYIGGLDVVLEIVFNLLDIFGGKKFIYNGVIMLFIVIVDFVEKGKIDLLFKELVWLVEEMYGIWNEQVEKYLLV